jgi:hypothetical protein
MNLLKRPMNSSPDSRPPAAKNQAMDKMDTLLERTINDLTNLQKDDQSPEAKQTVTLLASLTALIQMQQQTMGFILQQFDEMASQNKKLNEKIDQLIGGQVSQSGSRHYSPATTDSSAE